MMKDKLTKSNDSRFDRLCNRLRSFGICLFVVSAISFLPINHKLQVDNEVMAFEIPNEEENPVVEEAIPSNKDKLITLLKNYLSNASLSRSVFSYSKI